jgi:hypothetical protein
MSPETTIQKVRKASAATSVQNIVRASSRTRTQHRGTSTQHRGTSTVSLSTSTRKSDANPEQLIAMSLGYANEKSQNKSR